MAELVEGGGRIPGRSQGVEGKSHAQAYSIQLSAQMVYICLSIKDTLGLHIDDTHIPIFGTGSAAALIPTAALTDVSCSGTVIT